MKKEEQQVIKYVLFGAIAYFGVLKPILQKLGIVQTKEDVLVNNQSNLPNSENPFSPVFYKKAGAGALLLKKDFANQLAKRIYNAMGYISDDESEVYSVFRLLKSQSQVSFLADVFQQNYKSDLLEFLKKGKNQFNFASGLNSDELSIVLNIVNKLPKYK